MQLNQVPPLTSSFSFESSTRDALNEETFERLNPTFVADLWMDIKG